MKRRKKRSMAVFTVAFLALISTSVYVADTSAGKALTQADKDRISFAHSITADQVLATRPPGPEYKKGTLHHIILGKHHRDLWTAPVTAPVLRPDTIYGGLVLTKIGGSQQSLSLQMQAADGRKYAVRTVNKDQSKALPDWLQSTFAGKLFRDQASALHPYGAIAVAPLAEKAGLLHTNPKYYFVPFNKRFGDATTQIAGQLVMVEEYPDETWQGTAIYGNADTIIDTEDLLEMYYDGIPITLDAKEYARCRLLDILISDWDRHSDQWHWAGNLQDGVYHFRPIIRDRDAAFYKYEDGLMNKISLLINPKFQTLDDDVGYLKALVFNGLYLDRMILPKLTEAQWREQAAILQKELTDEYIMSSMMKMPQPGFELSGETIGRMIISRRNELDEVAEDFYQIVMKEITLTGTDKNEVVKISGSSDTILLTMHSEGRMIYNLRLPVKKIESINILQLGGNDQALVAGKFRSSATVSIAGGAGKDVFSDQATTSGLLRPVKFIDTAEGNEVTLHKSARFKSEENLAEMDYDRTGDRLKIK